MSKYYCMAGLRIGFVISDKTIIEDIHQETKNFNLAVSGITQRIAQLVIEDDSILKMNFSYCKSNFHYLYSELSNLSGVQFVIPEAGYFVCLKILDEHGNNYEADCIFEKTGIILRDGRSFKMDGYHRMNISCDRAVLTQVIERIKEMKNGG